MVQNRVALWMKLKRRTSLSLLNGDATVLDLDLCTILHAHATNFSVCGATLDATSFDLSPAHSTVYNLIGTSITAALLDLCSMLDTLS